MHADNVLTKLTRERMKIHLTYNAVLLWRYQDYYTISLPMGQLYLPGFTDKIG